MKGVSVERGAGVGERGSGRFESMGGDLRGRVRVERIRYVSESQLCLMRKSDL